MKILSKITKIEFKNKATLELIEGFFSKNNINPVRWAIIGSDKGFLTISYANFE